MNKKINNLFLVSIILFMVHGIEEYFAEFYLVDKSFLLIFGRLNNNLTVVFIVYQLILWGPLLIAYAVVKNGTWVKPLTIIVSIIMFFELQHIYETIMTGTYYPGAYSATLLPIVAFLLWKELLTNFERHGRN